MVRLKENYYHIIKRIAQISIPYGAIKRRISRNILICYYISIPYGAIKRVVIGARRVQTQLFQFLMVRLKVADGTRINLSVGLFQFLMVRLKVLFCKFALTSARISIPYGAIKSFFEKNNNRYSNDFNSLWCD